MFQKSVFNFFTIFLYLNESDTARATRAAQGGTDVRVLLPSRRDVKDVTEGRNSETRETGDAQKNILGICYLRRESWTA